jgi:hypothetical protein
VFQWIQKYKWKFKYKHFIKYVCEICVMNVCYNNISDKILLILIRMIDKK